MAAPCVPCSAGVHVPRCMFITELLIAPQEVTLSSKASTKMCCLLSDVCCVLCLWQTVSVQQYYHAYSYLYGKKRTVKMGINVMAVEYE